MTEALNYVGHTRNWTQDQADKIQHSTNWTNENSNYIHCWYKHWRADPVTQKAAHVVFYIHVYTMY